MAENYKFFRNTDCEYFPCHKGVDPDKFNCLFCYCPLYMQGRECGGNYRYLDSGIKSCKDCAFPHKKENYDRVIAAISQVLRNTGKNGDRTLRGQEQT